MKNLLKVIAISSLFFAASPSVAQVTWGVNVHVGNYPPPPPPPPQQEVIVQRPCGEDVVWVPGYYAYHPREVRYVWMPGASQSRPRYGARWMPPHYYYSQAYSEDHDHDHGHGRGRWKEGHWR
jgi:hypothetical protein